MALLIVLLILSLPTWPYSAAWGFYPSGGLGVVLLVLLIVLLTRNRELMGDAVNPPVLTWLGWATFATMTIAAIGVLVL